jgi:maleylacetoacetate isomerase/maleylpyruvate isomerase
VQLYHYFRSSASYRVRIALALKGLACELLPVHLVRGEHQREPYSALSASRLVPLLGDHDHWLGQSMAIIEYLDELHPQPPLLPGSALDRARIRGLAQDLACDVHPLNNLRVLRYLKDELHVDEDAKNAWYRHWVDTGLRTLEQQLCGDPRTGRHCHGEQPTLADCVLVPQIHNAQRFQCNLGSVPTVMRIFDACMQLDAFAKTQPSAYPDTPA